ncbi:prepilin peptidase [Halanaerobacter jeridensis]|uniref:Prepilin leader peptidase/N-methyltransferase n=1 Tax=Halanaerobacter jeridensis TaxID=706427 RepID=A0A938XX35_9FIRM|nr:A24 family peptidase [Halanaerobacter jeridensis]MBM7556890.1 leader peptidase (prepilin peptidase)/N-methyltransferase [Halanaerobacter jeridensis]
MTATLVFIFGLMIGSFLNVVIYRLPQEESIVFPSSHCPDCGTELQAIDLIPVVSFLWNKGHCRYCGSKISYQYPLVELLTALIFILLYHQYYLTMQFVVYALLASALIAVSIIDLQHLIIPNQITYPGIIVAFLLSFLNPEISYINSLLGILGPALLLFLIAVVSRGGLGMGDVKLIAVLGGFIGWQKALVAIFIGSIIGSIIGLYLIVVSDKGLKSKLPLGVFLSLGGLVMILWGQEIIDFYWQLIL